MYRKRNKDKLQTRRKTQEDYMSVVPFQPKRVVPATPASITNKPQQKHKWLDIALHRTSVLTAIGLSLCLMGLEAFMGYNVAFEQAKNPNAQLILAYFNVSAALFTFILPEIATRAKAAWIIWGIITFPYSTYNTYTWMHQNWSDVVVAKKEIETSEIRALRERYQTVRQQAYDECHTGKNGSQRGPMCTTKEGEEKKAYEAWTDKKNERDETIDPRNTAVVKLLSSLKLEVSLDQVKTAIALLVSLIPPCGGLVFKFAIKSLKRED